MSAHSKVYLVTGAAGFIGARFVESLEARGISAIRVDRLSHFKTRPELAAMMMVQARLGSEIVERDELWSWLAGQKNGTKNGTRNASRISAVVHLGACANTMETDEAYLDRVNLDYSKKLWNFARERDVPFVYASSAATYGDGAEGYDDDESRIARLAPLNLYGWSKQNFDLWALTEERAGRVPPAWAGFKFFNVYGFGERHKGGMASVVLHAHDQIQRDGQVRLFRSHRDGIADGHQKRDFIAVEDVVKVLHFALEKPIQRGIFNLGTGQARTFLDLANATFVAMHREPRIEFVDTPLQIRDKYQYFTEARMDRLRAEGYREPFMSLEEAVRLYVVAMS
jgi:ADP-L-glycero-D-manno-heptose 6-epimerase